MATKSYSTTIKRAKQAGYWVALVFFYLDSHDLAVQRVKTRVIEGGHNIPKPVIIRRYYAGLKNLFKRYIPICDYWMVFDNSKLYSKLIAEGYTDKTIAIKNHCTFNSIKHKAQND